MSAYWLEVLSKCENVITFFICINIDIELIIFICSWQIKKPFLDQYKNIIQWCTLVTCRIDGYISHELSTNMAIPL
jgi:hypothetical protein